MDDSRFRAREFSDWMTDIEADSSLLRELLKHLAKHEADKSKLESKVLHKVVESAVGKIADTRIANWRADSSATPLKTGEIEALMRYFIALYPALDIGAPKGGPDKRSLTRLVEVAMRLTDFLNVGDTSRRLIRNRLEGLYWVYRPSVLAPGRYVRGLVAMWWAAEPQRHRQQYGMISVCEVHRHVDVENGIPELSEVFDGFAIIKQGTVFLFLSERYEDDRGPLLVARLHRFIPSDPKQPLQMASGRVQGPLDAGHAPPVLVVRAECANKPESLALVVDGRWKSPPRIIRELDAMNKMVDQCGILDREDVPPSVLAKLDAMNVEALVWAEQLITGASRR